MHYDVMKPDTTLDIKIKPHSHTPASSPIVKPSNLDVNSIKRLKIEARHDLLPLQQLQSLPYLYIRMTSTWIQVNVENVDTHISRANAKPMAGSAITSEAKATSQASARSQVSAATTGKATVPQQRKG